MAACYDNYNLPTAGSMTLTLHWVLTV